METETWTYWRLGYAQKGNGYHMALDKIVLVSWRSLSIGIGVLNKTSSKNSHLHF